MRKERADTTRHSTLTIDSDFYTERKSTRFSFEVDLFIFPIRHGESTFSMEDVIFFNNGKSTCGSISMIPFEEQMDGYRFDLHMFNKHFSHAIVAISSIDFNPDKLPIDVTYTFSSGIKYSQRITRNDQHTHNISVVGVLGKDGDHLSLSDTNISCATEMEGFLARLENTDLSINWCQAMISLSGLGENKRQDKARQLPWLSENQVIDFMRMDYTTAYARVHGKQILSDLGFSSADTGLNPAQKSLIHRLIEDGASWVSAINTQPVSEALLDNIDRLVAIGAQNTSWSTTILDTISRNDIDAYVKSSQDRADRLYAAYPKDFLYSGISTHAKRNKLGNDFGL